MEWQLTFTRILTGAFVAALVGGAALAQSGPEYFDGKTVSYLVGTNPGGVYDTNGRLVAEFMQRHLPGSTFVVRNVPGAGSIVGANTIYASDPDGLTIGTFNTGLIYAQLVQNPALKLDLTKMSWIGKVASDPRVFVVSEQSGITSFEQLRAAKVPVKFATCGVGCASMIESTMLVNSFDLPIQIISGYNGNEDQLAMRRGEVQGLLGSRSEFEQFVKDGHGRFIAQIGGTNTDVPQLMSFATSDVEKSAVTLVASQGELSRLTAAPQGVPAEVLETLRAAYAAATSDPEFLAKAEALQLPVDPKVGDAVGALVEDALNQPPEVVAFLKEATKAE